MTPRIRLCVLLPAVFTLCSGCCGLFAHPSVAQVQQWAAKELPPGSIVADVKQFCGRHRFEYEGPAAGGHYLIATCTIDTCMWIYAAYIEMDVYLDEDDRVKSVNARRAGFWL